MALLQRQQSSQTRDEEGRRSSVLAKTSPAAAAMGEGGGGGGGARRPSTFMGLTGPKTASISSPTRPPGPSLFGVLASKRLAKRFASRFHRRRQGTLSSMVSSGGGAQPLVLTEPTYRMEPHRKFRPSEVEAMLKRLLESRMDKFRYSARICANMCKVLGDDIKDQVKQMDFDRYKIVSNVVIGQKKDQAVIMCSRCAWDEKLDNFASYTFQNEHIFCTAVVFGIYME